jgi:hypothetical protein
MPAGSVPPDRTGVAILQGVDGGARRAEVRGKFAQHVGGWFDHD